MATRNGGRQRLDVHHVRRLVHRLRKQLDGRKPLERFEVLLRPLPAGPDGHRLEPAGPEVGRQQAAGPRGQVGERRFVRRQIQANTGQVDRAADLALLQVRHERPARLDADGRLRLIRARPQVWRQNHVVAGEQRMILRRRLAREDVDRRPADLACLQRLGERVLVDDFAAGVVDDEQVVLGDLHQPTLVEQVPRAAAAGDVEGDDVELGEELVEVGDDFHLAVERGLAFEERVVAEDVHLHGDRALRHGLPDAAQADDAERLAGQLRALEQALFPVAGLHVRVGRRNLPGQRVHERQRVLGRRERAGGGGVDDENALGRRGGQVDVVDADARPRNRLEPAWIGENSLRHLRPATNG